VKGVIMALKKSILVSLEAVKCADPDEDDYEDVIGTGVLRPCSNNEYLFRGVTIKAKRVVEKGNDIIIHSALGNRFSFWRLPPERVEEFCMKNVEVRCGKKYGEIFPRVEIQNPLTGEWKVIKTLDKSETKKYLGV
jgi:hypothetical protein